MFTLGMSFNLFNFLLGLFSPIWFPAAILLMVHIAIWVDSKRK